MSVTDIYQAKAGESHEAALQAVYDAGVAEGRNTAHVPLFVSDEPLVIENNVEAMPEGVKSDVAAQ